MEFEENKRSDPVKLARVLRVFSILQIVRRQNKPIVSRDPDQKI